MPSGVQKLMRGQTPHGMEAMAPGFCSPLMPPSNGTQTLNLQKKNAKYNVSN